MTSQTLMVVSADPESNSPLATSGPAAVPTDRRLVTVPLCCPTSVHMRALLGALSCRVKHSCL